METDTKSTYCHKPHSSSGVWPPKEMLSWRWQGRHSTGGFGYLWNTPYTEGNWSFLHYPAESWCTEGWGSFMEDSTNHQQPHCSLEQLTGTTDQEKNLHIYLISAAQTSISLISICCSPLFCSTKCFRQHLPMVSVQSLSLFSINSMKRQIPWRTLSHLYLEGIFLCC